MGSNKESGVYYNNTSSFEIYVRGSYYERPAYLKIFTKNHPLFSDHRSYLPTLFRARHRIHPTFTHPRQQSLFPRETFQPLRTEKSPCYLKERNNTYRDNNAAGHCAPLRPWGSCNKKIPWFWRNLMVPRKRWKKFRDVAPPIRFRPCNFLPSVLFLDVDKWVFNKRLMRDCGENLLL